MRGRKLPIKEEVMLFSACRSENPDEVALLHVEAITDMLEMMRLENFINNFNRKNNGKTQKWRKNFRQLL